MRFHRLGDNEMLYTGLRERWERLAHRNALQNAKEVFEADIISSYARPERTYHNLTYLENCFQKFERIRWFFRCPDVIEFALFYHDAVCVPGACDNEEQSAALFMRTAYAHNFPDDFVLEVSKCILATKRHMVDPSLAPDIALLIDIDLSALGAKPCQYHDDVEALRMEYLRNCLSEDAWMCYRMTFIREMLEGRPKIYLTALFRSTYEERARANLMEERSQLQCAT